MQCVVSTANPFVASGPADSLSALFSSIVAAKLAPFFFERAKLAPVGSGSSIFS
jgi:hypothetical protein